jgi:hypothetical protein
MTLEDFLRRGQAAQRAVDAILTDAQGAPHAMTQPITAYYIATVWKATPATPDQDPAADQWATTRQVIRLQAVGEADFADRVRALWPGHSLTFGPIGRSKVQS